jgi:hypothetical protein
MAQAAAALELAGGERTRRPTHQRGDEGTAGLGGLAGAGGAGRENLLA